MAGLGYSACLMHDLQYKEFKNEGNIIITCRMRLKSEECAAPASIKMLVFYPVVLHVHYWRDVMLMRAHGLM